MTIICGTDLSDASRGALDVAAALAILRGDSELVLVHVIDPEAGGAATREESIDRARAELDAEAARIKGPIVRSELIVGPPHTTLISVADTEASDLIVIAARSTPGEGGHLRLGSTADHVIARARVPVIVVRDPAPWLAFAQSTSRPLRVLLGIDDSVACDLGIQWVHGLRKRGPVEVVLGAIYYPDDAAAYYGVHAETLVDRDPEIERLLSRDLIRRFGVAERVSAKPRRGLGRIGDHVVELAREEAVDVIVVGTGQKTGLDRLGSVSSIIVNDASQSIVCVPPNAAIPTLTVPAVASALVATDLSPFANRAVPYAFGLTPEGGDVHVVHVIKDGAEVDDAELTRALYALAPVGSKRNVSAHIVRGEDAATVLAQTAARLGADVICIASHGRSGITRALVGSVADRLLRATRKPVLVLRPA
ncbi:MAG: Universal stress protein [Myxococcales bacterium]|nr:Universal stress protein [Myxococcales bacterium]